MSIINENVRNLILARYPHLVHVKSDKTFAFNATSLAAIPGVTASDYHELALIANGKPVIVPIAKYAEMHSKDASGVRAKCIRGGFKSAVKMGRDWFIDKNEPYSDKRRK